MSEIEELCKITNFLSALFFVFTEITKVGWSKKVLVLGPLSTELQIDSKSASEESHVCIAIASLYISLSGLS